MDINEIDIKMDHRHPWELSRARDVLRTLAPVLNGRAGLVIDLGAGDQFFDDALLDRYPGLRVNAVDIGYTASALEKLKARVRHPDRIRSVQTLSDAENEADLALMMDSLEYMEDEVVCLRALAEHVRPGGTVLLTVPAFQFLFSRFDLNVNGRCRYVKKDVRRFVGEVPGLKVERMHYFYTSLFAARLAQKVLRVNIDPDHKVISGWPYPENAFATKLVKGVLLIDFRVNALLGKAHLDLPGLSLLAICRKTGA